MKRTSSKAAAATERSAPVLVRELQRSLAAAGNPRRAAGARAYLKSDLAFYGVASPALYEIVLGFRRRHPDLSRTVMFSLVRQLWASRNHELRSCAIALLEAHAPKRQGRQPAWTLGARDLPLLERLLRDSRSWAYVDWLATRVVAPIVERDASASGVLERWANDSDFWIRRSALLALLPALKRGEGDFDRFTAIAAPMIHEGEFFIRKAIGWVLREVGKKRPRLTAGFIEPHASRVSGTTWREAVKYLPLDDRRRLEALRRGAGPRAHPIPARATRNPRPATGSRPRKRNPT